MKISGMTRDSPMLRRVWNRLSGKLGSYLFKMAALHASGVSEDSLLRDPSRIPFLDSVPATQNPTGPVDEEETDSLRELVEQIDAHVEVIGAEATSNPPANDQPSENTQ